LDPGLPADARTGLHQIVVTGLRSPDARLTGQPILHLDATPRPELAKTILPGLVVHNVTADAPHVAVRCVQGRVGKATLYHDPLASDAQIGAVDRDCRPLPHHLALRSLAGGSFGHAPERDYELVLRSVPLRDGPARVRRVTLHAAAKAELLCLGCDRTTFSVTAPDHPQYRHQATAKTRPRGMTFWDFTVTPASA
jgi:hypothetical protein